MNPRRVFTSHTTITMAPQSLKFIVRRKQEVLLVPSQQTPRKILYLSNIDDQAALRFHIPIMQFYKNNPSKQDPSIHPATLIKQSLERLLVHYYPFAGRLRDAEGGKLALDCNGEGILFIEADAEVSLHEFGDSQPPFPCWEDLLYDVPGSKVLTNSPLLLIQVTRLKCGGFIFALRLNHTMADAVGLAQFMEALGEITEGASAPSIKPIWQRRNLLQHRNPPQVKVDLHEYAQLQGKIFPVSKMEHHSFFFGPKEIAILRSQARVPEKVSTFEILCAFSWKLRTRSLQMPANQEVRLIFPLDGRGRFKRPLPKGYYGNVITFACAKSTATEIATSELSFAVRLIRQAKIAVNEEYLRSVVDTMEVSGRPHFTVVGAFLISDLTKIGFEKIDLGWGEPVYGGAAEGGPGAVPGLSSFFIPWKDKNGVSGILLPMRLPAPAMARFRAELSQTLNCGLVSSL